ncbi:MAG TPA: alpha/beta fold hydrolase [Polyangiaceae bacterium]|nr:alpha/beta fold hydrolase [Polyangiaceae bacterium]
MDDSLRWFHAGDVELLSGETLHDAQLAVATFGELNGARDNVVLFPTYYTGTHRENARLVGEGRALDPTRYFIVVPNLFGNGVSSSPSNHPTQGGPDFPCVAEYDNVVCQKRMLAELFGVERVRVAFGWSMGAQQALHFAALYPDCLDALLAVCGSAKTSPHNRVFLEGVKAALLADPDFAGGRYTRPPARGLTAFGRVYAGWAYSQRFFREGLYRRLGYPSVEALLDDWGADHRARDANDLLAMLDTWQRADVSDNPLYGGDLRRALGSVKARSIVMPASTDLYFPPEDSALEVALMPDAELRILETDYGHVGGGPGRVPEATAFIETALRELLEGVR